MAKDIIVSRENIGFLEQMVIDLKQHCIALDILLSYQDDELADMENVDILQTRLDLAMERVCLLKTLCSNATTFEKCVVEGIDFDYA